MELLKKLSGAGTILLEFQSPYSVDECHKRLMAHASYPPSLTERLFKGKQYLDVKLHLVEPGQETFTLIHGTSCTAQGELKTEGAATAVTGQASLHVGRSLFTFMPTMIFALAALLFGRIPLLAFALVIGGVILFLLVWALLVDRPRQKKLARLVENTLRGTDA
jgi:hypothetical protein